MSVAILYGLVGLSVGLATYAFLMWLAQNVEREQSQSEAALNAQQLRVLAHANLVLIPVLMYLFGAAE
ncbi:MAG TPA: hypothetical protein VNK52_10315 [Hyphomicrobiaceae bacterium]|nr:hypothetical protein [Hyphomicrobiaceae bacterium]